MPKFPFIVVVPPLDGDPVDVRIVRTDSEWGDDLLARMEARFPWADEFIPCATIDDAREVHYEETRNLSEEKDRVIRRLHSRPR